MFDAKTWKALATVAQSEAACEAIREEIRPSLESFRESLLKLDRFSQEAGYAGAWEAMTHSLSDEARRAALVLLRELQKAGTKASEAGWTLLLLRLPRNMLPHDLRLEKDAMIEQLEGMGFYFSKDAWEGKS